MTTLYRRPTRRVALSVEPRLASWDVAGSPGQVRLGDFLDHAEALAAPMIAAVDGLLAVELTVGLHSELALTGGGRDLDNYLFPLAQRLGPARITAMFGRKVHGPSFLAVGQAQPDHPTAPPQFSAQIAGSYIRTEWKATLRERLLQGVHSEGSARPQVQRARIPGALWVPATRSRRSGVRSRSFRAGCRSCKSLPPRLATTRPRLLPAIGSDRAGEWPARPGLGWALVSRPGRSSVRSGF